MAFAVNILLRTFSASRFPLTCLGFFSYQLKCYLLGNIICQKAFLTPPFKYIYFCANNFIILSCFISSHYLRGYRFVVLPILVCLWHESNLFEGLQA